MTTPLTQQQLLNYYASKLIIQYNGLPKATATIEALVNCSICDNFFLTLQNCFNLETATGEQLTIIGRLVGVPRLVYGLDLVDTFITFTNWNGQPASVGYNTWANTSPDPDKWASWLSTVVYSPTDFEMLALIQLKIMRNNYFPSLGQLVPPLYEIFGNGITLTDNFNKTISYTFKQPYWNVGSVCAFLNNICPKPMGNSISYANI